MRRILAYAVSLCMIAASVWGGTEEVRGEGAQIVKRAPWSMASMYELNSSFDGDTAGEEPQGWNCSAQGGTVTVESDNETSANKYARFSLQSVNATLDMRKTSSMISGILAVECRVRIDSINSMKVIAPCLYDHFGRTAALVTIDSGYIKVLNGSDTETVQAVVPGQWYRIKLVVDTDEDKYDVFVDGVQKKFSLGLKNKVTDINQILFRAEGSNAGTLQVDDVKVYPEEGLKPAPTPSWVLMNNNFEEEAPGKAPAGWSITTSGGTAAVVEDGSGGKCVKLTKPVKNDGKAVSALKSFGSQTGVLRISYRMKSEEAGGWRNSPYIQNSAGNNAISIAFNGPDIVYHNNTSQPVLIKDFVPNRWYGVTVIADITANKYDVYIDGVKLLEQASMRVKVSDLNRLFFQMGSDCAGAMYFDDVKVEKPPELQSPTEPTSTPTPLPSGAPVPPAPEGWVMEGEEMLLSNYSIVDSVYAHNGKLIKVPSPGEGSAAFAFDGQLGYYAIRVGYYEPYGAYDSNYKLKQNGQYIDQWMGQYDDNGVHVRKAKESWYVSPGDVFIIEGMYGKDPSYVDYIEFAAATPPTLDRGYLIFEEVWGIGGLVPSSWIAYEEGGSVRQKALPEGDLGEGNNAIVLTDTSAKASVAAERRFLEQKDGSITLDFQCKIPVKADGIAVALRSGGLTGVKLVTREGNLCYERQDGSTVTLMENYEANRWYGVKMTVDLDSDKMDLFINGSRYKATDIPLMNGVNSLDNLYISTPGNGKAEVAIGTVVMVKGYLAFDSFLTTEAGSIPPYWAVDNTGGSGSIQLIKSNRFPDFQSLKLEDTSTTAGVTATREFSPVRKEQITLEYEFMLPAKVDGMTVSLSNPSCDGIRITTYQGNICYEENNGTLVPVWNNYKANLWYNIKIVADLQKNEAEIYVNKISKLKNVHLTKKMKEYDRLEFTTPYADTGDLWVDDIKLFVGTYESSVPEPQRTTPAQNGYGDNMIVGVQACDLWREGAHFGYDLLAPYDNRIPYLGYYEDGNPEVADWETKWMVEHGIGLYYTSWYRPKKTEGSPVKTPRNAAKINDGFLNSKYVDRIQFAIMFENNSAGVTGVEDFKENVVKYWIERYFKHPSYLKIDNKPVIGVWNYTALSNQLGGVQQNAQVFAEIEQMLMEEGFDGAIFITQPNGAVDNRLADIRNSGYDYVYNYNYNDKDLEFQKTLLQQQKDKTKEISAQGEAIDILPVISQGWGNEPWADVYRKNNMQLSDWKAGLQWMKDSYMPQSSRESLGSRLILLGNWNELSEGHFIIPSNLKGFGYVDGIREVFTGESELPHTDIVPEEAQLGPYDSLTPKLWGSRWDVPGYDRKAPEVIKAETNAAGNRIILTFSKPMASPTVKESEFLMEVGSAVRSIKDISLGRDRKEMEFLLDSPVTQGDIIRISYTAGTVSAYDMAALPSFTRKTVTNRVNVP